MYTNLLNTNHAGNYTPKRNYGRSDYNSNTELSNKVVSKSQKLIKESEILNSRKISTNLKIDGKTDPSTPVVKSRKTFKSILETFLKNPELLANISITSPDAVLASKETLTSAELDSLNANYIISFNDNSENRAKHNSPLLKRHNKLFENYNLHLRRDPGTLINVTV